VLALATGRSRAEGALWALVAHTFWWLIAVTAYAAWSTRAGGLI
jgi:hypothetical protein